jgi:hypothetical protein
VDNEAEESTLALWTLLLVNYCERQPLGRFVSYGYIQGIIGFHPLKTREGRAIMRQAIRSLVAAGFVYLIESGQGIYLAFYRRDGLEGLSCQHQES